MDPSSTVPLRLSSNSKEITMFHDQLKTYRHKPYWGASLALALLAAQLSSAQSPNATASPESSKDGMLLSLTCDRKTYKVGDPITVTAGFTNISDAPISFERETPTFFFFYRFIVVRTTGIDSVTVPLTDRGKEETDIHNFGGWQGSKLPPGGQNKSVFQLNELFEMSMPGTYKIIVAAHAMTKGSGKNKADSRSDLLTLTVEKRGAN
jgi:hypothetical protein